MSLAQATRRRSGAGDKLPDVWPSLAAAGVHVRRGQLHLISAAPGVGKSAWALTYACRAGVPTLFLSMDSDAHTTAVRVAQMVTSFDGDAAESALEDTTFRDRTLAEVGHIRFCFRSGMSTDDLMLEVAAYGEAFGAYPVLTIVDNLANISFDGDEFSELRRIVADLHSLSRLTHTAVMALHHVSGAYDDGTTPVPQSGLQGKISKMPEVVLTLTKGTEDDYLYVAPVKNRSGRADPSGRWRIGLAADLDHMDIRESA